MKETGLIPGATETDDSERYRYIDALRGYAILGVIAVHAYILAGFRFSNPLLHALFANGARGVQLFYLVSALTLFLSQERRKEQGRAALAGFYVRRFFRIAPMFYFGVVLYWVTLRPPAAPLWQVATGAFGFSPHTLNAVFPGCWSIAIETSYYLLFPLIFLAVRNLAAAVAWLALTLAVAPWAFDCYMRAWFPGLDTQLAYDFHFHWIVNQLPVFALGAVVYFFVRGHIPGGNRRAGLAGLSLGVAVVLVGFLLAGDPYYGGDLQKLPLPGWLQPFLIATGGLAIVVVGAFHLNDKVLCNLPVIWLGRVSYSLYIFNFIILHFLAKFFPRPVEHAGMFWFFCTSALIVGGTLSFLTQQLIENPGIALGRRLTRTLSRSGDRPTAVR